MHISTESIYHAPNNIFRHYTRGLKVGLTICIEGNEHLKSGVGKSYTALKIGEMNDKDYREGTRAMDKICFKPRDFEKGMNIIEEQGYPAQVIEIDEAGLLVNRKKWYSYVNRAMSDVVMTMRLLKNIAAFVTPSIWRMEKDIREYSSYLIKNNKLVGANSNLKRGYGKTYVESKIYKLHWDEHRNKVYRKGTLVYNREDGRVHQVGVLYAAMPSNVDLLIEYEKKARKYKKEARKIISDMAHEEMDIEEWTDIVLKDKKLITKTKQGARKVNANTVRYEYKITADLAKEIGRRVNEALAKEDMEKIRARGATDGSK